MKQLDLEAYQPLAMRTAKKMDSLRDQLLHGAFGCCTEPGELALTVAAWSANPSGDVDMKNVVEELGDGMWFAAYMADALGTTLHAITREFKHTPLATEAIGELALRYCAAGADIGTLIKAHAFYGKELVVDQLKNALSLYVALSAQICQGFGIDGVDVLGHNIEKLTLRYPDKYSDQAAIARADKAVDDTTLTTAPVHAQVRDPSEPEWIGGEVVDAAVNESASITGLSARTVTEDGSPSSVN